MLHNVLLWDDRLHFYVPDELADAVPDEAHRAPTQQQLKVDGAWWDEAMEHFQVGPADCHIHEGATSIGAGMGSPAVH